MILLKGYSYKLRFVKDTFVDFSDDDNLEKVCSCGSCGSCGSYSVGDEIEVEVCSCGSYSVGDEIEVEVIEIYDDTVTLFLPADTLEEEDFYLIKVPIDSFIIVA